MKYHRFAFWLLFSFTLLEGDACADVTARLTDDNADNSAIEEPTVVRSVAAMQAFLSSPTFSKSPLASLSPGGLKRFIASLRDRNGRFFTLSPHDLQAELSSSQIDAVWRLIDLEELNGRYKGNDRPHARYALETNFDRRFTALNLALEAADHSANDDVVLDHHERLFPDGVNRESLSQLNNHDLALAFRALHMFADAHGSPDALARLRLALRLLRERDVETGKQVTVVHDLLVAERRFAEAESLESDFADFELTPVPRHRELEEPSTSGPTLLSVFDNGNGLRREARSLGEGLQIVVVASCHFSKDAARDIESDPRTAMLFRDHATWLASENESFGNVANWNSEFPGQPIHIAWSEAEWPMLDSWAMPTFYVFRDGEKIVQWSGWPADTGMQTLREKLAVAGVDY